MTIDPDSPTWRLIEAHLTQRIERMREQNDSLELTAERTLALRAEIQACKELLTLPKQLAAAASAQGAGSVAYLDPDLGFE